MSDPTTTIYELTNPPFTFKLGGREFQVTRVNISQVAQYRKRISELSSTPGSEYKLITYAIFLVLNKADPTITEDWVIENTPGDVDIFKCLEVLGFMNPRQLEIAQKLSEGQTKILTSSNSSPFSEMPSAGPLS